MSMENNNSYVCYTLKSYKVLLRYDPCRGHMGRIFLINAKTGNMPSDTYNDSVKYLSLKVTKEFREVDRNYKMSNHLGSSLALNRNVNRKLRCGAFGSVFISSHIIISSCIYTKHPHPAFPVC